jgi:hypothetical protein
MDYKTFRISIVQQHGPLFFKIVEMLLKQATEFANNGQIEDAFEIGKDMMCFAKYSNAGYGNLYVIGMLCQLYIDKGERQKAQEAFEAGMKMIAHARELGYDNENYDWDVNAFLDLKIRINKELSQ